MPYKSMTKDDETDAIMALVRWFESQEIAPCDSVPIMAKTIAVAVYSHVRENRNPGDKANAAIRTGLQLAANMVVGAFKKLPNE